jgi:hypothetical protein
MVVTHIDRFTQIALTLTVYIHTPTVSAHFSDCYRYCKNEDRCLLRNYVVYFVRSLLTFRRILMLPYSWSKSKPSKQTKNKQVHQTTRHHVLELCHIREELLFPSYF